MLLLCLPAAMPAMAAEGDAAAVATATRLLDHMQAGEYEAATADFTAQMKDALGVGKPAPVHAQMAAAGAEPGPADPVAAEPYDQTDLAVRNTRASSPTPEKASC